MKNPILILFLLTLFSCKKEIKFEHEIVEISADGFDQCKATDCPSIEISYPVFSKPIEAKEKFNKGIELAILRILNNPEDRTEHNLFTILENRITEAQNAYPEQVNSLNKQEIELHASVLYSNTEVLSLKLDSYQFSGGAHGVYNVSYLNMNPKSGVVYEKDDFIQDAKGFSVLAQAKFIEKYGPLENYWFEKNLFRLPKQIGFNESGIEIYYAVYEIASYSDGDFELTFTWEEIDDYIAF